MGHVRWTDEEKKHVVETAALLATEYKHPFTLTSLFRDAQKDLPIARQRKLTGRVLLEPLVEATNLLLVKLGGKPLEFKEVKRLNKKEETPKDAVEVIEIPEVGFSMTVPAGGFKKTFDQYEKPKENKQPEKPRESVSEQTYKNLLKAGMLPFLEAAIDAAPDFWTPYDIFSKAFRNFAAECKKHEKPFVHIGLKDDKGNMRFVGFLRKTGDRYWGVGNFSSAEPFPDWATAIIEAKKQPEFQRFELFKMSDSPFPAVA